MKTMDTISEHDFHVLYEERPEASTVMQGFARMLGIEAYFAMHNAMNVQNLSFLIRSFGQEPLSDEASGLWKQVRVIFGLPELDTYALKALEDSNKTSNKKDAPSK